MIRILIICITLASSLHAGTWRGHYCAVIGPKDRMGSTGYALHTVAEIIRQERANYHKFGIIDEGDQDDSFFTTTQRRGLIEKFIQPGSYSERDRILIEETDLVLEYCVYFEGYDFPEIKPDGSLTARMDIDVISHRSEFTF